MVWFPSRYLRGVKGRLEDLATIDFELLSKFWNEHQVDPYHDSAFYEMPPAMPRFTFIGTAPRRPPDAGTKPWQCLASRRCSRGVRGSQTSCACHGSEHGPEIEPLGLLDRDHRL